MFLVEINICCITEKNLLTSGQSEHDSRHFRSFENHFWNIVLLFPEIARTNRLWSGKDSSRNAHKTGMHTKLECTQNWNA